MGATTIGALIGGAIDALSGDDDSAADGAIEGAIVANVVKAALPLVVTFAVGWAVMKGASALKQRAFGSDHAS